MIEPLEIPDGTQAECFLEVEAKINEIVKVVNILMSAHPKLSDQILDMLKPWNINKFETLTDSEQEYGKGIHQTLADPEE